MKKILLVLLVFAALEVTAQQTFDLDWQQGINGDAASLTIGVDDTVRWTWTNDAPHNVVSDSGSSESFASETVSQENFQYSYTFTQEGENPYRCTIHPGSMFGTITVVESLSVEDTFRLNLKSFPNPVDNQLTVTSLVKMTTIEVYSMLGKKVLSTNIGSENVAAVTMSNLQSGLYFVNVTAQDGQQSVLRVMKR